MNKEKWPIVSILMTLYNRQEFISESIESVQTSTYQNWELIILDDNSIDSSFNIAKEYAASDKRIKVYRNNKNLGQFKNRNKALEYANGEYIKYLDSDDTIYPYSLMVMVDYMEKHPNAAFGFQHTKIDDYIPYPILLNPLEAFLEHFLSKDGLFNCGPSGVIFRKSSLSKYGAFKTDTNYVGNDTELLIRIGIRENSLKLPPSLVWWRQHENQAYQEGERSGEYILNEYFMQLQCLNNSYDRIDESTIDRAKRYLKWKFSRKCLVLIKKREIFLATSLVKRTPLNLKDLFTGLFNYKIIN